MHDEDETPSMRRFGLRKKRLVTKDAAEVE